MREITVQEFIQNILEGHGVFKDDAEYLIGVFGRVDADNSIGFNAIRDSYTSDVPNDQINTVWAKCQAIAHTWAVENVPLMPYTKLFESPE